jgi:hypothetical protein
MKRHALFVAAALATLSTTSTTAFAGERTSLGELATLPAVKDIEDPGPHMGVPGLTLKEHSGRVAYYEITAATSQGYCLVMRDGIFELSSMTTESDVSELWRLVEKDGGATLEKTHYQIAPYLGNAWVKSKTSVTLKPLATDLGITAWGMRDTNGDLVVIAPRATSGNESGPQSKEGGGSMTHSACTYGATRIRASTLKAGGGTAQLTGRLPAEGGDGEGKATVEPAFIIDISAVKVARDPEPVISVRVRRAPLPT